jgi:signal transduction histidine kinase
MERERPRAARSDPSSLLGGLAAQLQDLQTSVARQAERFAAVIDIGTQISSARDLDDLLKTVVERLARLLGAEAATLFVHDATTDELWSKVLKGAALRELRIASKAGIAGAVFSSGKALVLGDAYSDPRFNPEVDRRTGFRTRSIVAVPLTHVSGRVMGVLEVLDGAVDRFTTDDRALVEGVATQVAAVLDHVQLVETLKARSGELAQRVNDLDVLYDVERAISSTEAQVDLLDRILGRAMELVGARAGSILIAEESQDSLYFRSAKGERSDALRALRLKAGQGIAGHVAATGEAVRVLRADDSEWHDQALARKLGAPVGAVLCVPIRAEGDVLGALELLNKKGGFTEADERLAVLLAGQIGRALVLQRSRADTERKARLAAIGQMLSGVLHDLRTPLTVVSGYAEMMADEADPELRLSMSKAIQGQLELINSMQKETLAFARGERSVLLRKTYLHVFMHDVEEQLQQDFARTRVELKVQVNYTGTARLDEAKLRRVIFNLSRNALDAMPDGGRFTLSVDREGDELVFRASDNGPGVPEAIADRLFESFVTAKANGTGLGLAIVRKIAREHGGDASFKSKPGKGTTFEVRFPAGAPAD